MHPSRILRGAAIAIVVAVAACSGGVDIDAENATIDRASADARAQLPRFWRAFESPAEGERGFLVQVRIADRNGREPLWLEGVHRESGNVSGLVLNEPVVVKNVKRGDRISIPESEISDWLYWRDQKMVGNFITRATLNYLPEKEAQQMRDTLADQ